MPLERVLELILINSLYELNFLNKRGYEMRKMRLNVD